MFGSRSRTRTCDMVINSHPLYQLSYSGMIGMAWECIKSGWYKYHILRDMSTGYLQGRRQRCCGFYADMGGSLQRYPPSCPFLSSMITSLAMAFKVSNTPVPSVAIAS